MDSVIEIERKESITEDHSFLKQQSSPTLPHKRLLPKSKDLSSDKTLESDDLLNDEQAPYAKVEFTNFQIVKIALVTIGLYLFDVSSDTYAAIAHYNEGQVFYCGFTAFCIGMPALITSILNARRYGYMGCLKDVTSPGHESAPVPKWLRAFRFTFTIAFPLSAMPSFADNLYYGMQYRKAKRSRNIKGMKTYFTALHAATGTVMLTHAREAFLETGPQLLFRLHIHYMAGEDEPAGSVWLPERFKDTVLIVLGPMFSLNWAFTAWRLHFGTMDSKRNDMENYLETRGTVVSVALWPVAAYPVVGVRIMFIYIFAELYAGWTVTLLAISVHILIVFGLLHMHFVEPDIKLKQVKNGAFASVFGYLHNNGRFPFLTYYAIWFVENVVMFISTTSVLLKGDVFDTVVVVMSSAAMVISCLEIYGLHTIEDIIKKKNK